MIYQASLKRQIAEINDVPPNTYHRMPFDQWSAIRDEATVGRCKLPYRVDAKDDES